MTETPRPDPFEEFHTQECAGNFLTIDGYAQRCDCGLDAARAAVDARHHAERKASGEILQAVLDAVKGTLDPSTQISDHPNVKFVQMQMLTLRATVAQQAETIRQLQAEKFEWHRALGAALERAYAADARCATLTTALEFYDFYSEMDFGETARAALASQRGKA